MNWRCLALFALLFSLSIAVGSESRQLSLMLDKTGYLVAEPISATVHLRPANSDDLYSTPFDWDGGVELQYRMLKSTEWRSYEGLLVRTDSTSIPQEFPQDGLHLEGFILYDVNRGRDFGDGESSNGVYALLANPGSYVVRAIYSDGRLSVQSNEVIVHVEAPAGRHAEAFEIWKDIDALVVAQGQYPDEGPDRGIKLLEELSEKYPDTVYGRAAASRLSTARLLRGDPLAETATYPSSTSSSSGLPPPTVTPKQDLSGGHSARSSRFLVFGGVVVLLVAIGLVLMAKRAVGGRRRQ